MLCPPKWLLKELLSAAGGILPSGGMRIYKSKCPASPPKNCTQLSSAYGRPCFGVVERQLGNQGHSLNVVYEEKEQLQNCAGRPQEGRPDSPPRIGFAIFLTVKDILPPVQKCADIDMIQ